MSRATAGIFAPLLVMAALLIQGLATPGYDPIRQTISELGTGWAGTGIVAIYGLLLLVFVIRPMSTALPGKRAAAIGTLLMIAIGCIGLNFVEAESHSWNSMTWRGQLHLVFAFGFVFAGIPAACFAVSRALPAAWRGLRVYGLLTSLGCAVLLLGTLVALGAKPPTEYVVAHLGLIERVYVFAFMIWQCIVSASLTRAFEKLHKDTR